MDLVPRDEDSAVEGSKIGSLLHEVSREITFPLLNPPATQPGQLFGGDNRGYPLVMPNVGGAAMEPSSVGRPGNDAAGLLLGSGDIRPTPIASRPSMGLSGGSKGRVGRRLIVGQILGRQLEERITHLFVVTRPLEPSVSYKAAVATHPTTNVVASVNRRRDLVLGDVIITSKDGEGVKVDALVERYHDWLWKVRDQAISPFELFTMPHRQDDGTMRDVTRGFNLVAMSMSGGGRNTLLVAAMPLSKITETFLSPFQDDPAAGCMIVNDDLTVMAASRPTMVGVDVSKSGDPNLLETLNVAKKSGDHAFTQFDRRFVMGGETFERSLLTAEPIRVGDRTWFAVLYTPTAGVEAVWGNLLRAVAGWGLVIGLLTLSVATYRSRRTA